MCALRKTLLLPLDDLLAVTHEFINTEVSHLRAEQVFASAWHGQPCRTASPSPHQTDLQEMAGENLMREQIRVASLQNHLLLGIKNEIRKGNIINGNILASLTRQEFEPIINAKHGAVTGRLGGEAGGGN